MGRPYTRLKYKPPEKYKPNSLIGYGEAVSMITDLLVPDGERRDMRRQVDNHVRYAVKNGTFGKSRAGIFRFDEIAAWANERYGKEIPNISRMHHGDIVEVGGVSYARNTGLPRLLADYGAHFEVRATVSSIAALFRFGLKGPGL